MVESAENQIALHTTYSHTNIIYVKLLVSYVWLMHTVTYTIYYNIMLLEGREYYGCTSLTVLY